MHFLKILVSCLILLGAAAGAVGCNGAGQATALTSSIKLTEPSRRQVQRGARQASVWRFVYCLEDETDPAGLAAFLHEVAGKQPFGKRIEVLSCIGLSQDTLGSGPLALFGDRLPPGADRLPLVRIATGWRFDDRHDLNTDGVLILPFYRNPWASRATVTGLYLSGDPARLVDRLRAEYDDNYDRMFWPNRAYELYRSNGDRTFGTFADTSWNFDAATEISLKAPDKPVYDRDGLVVYSYDGVVKPAEIKRVARTLLKISRLAEALFVSKATSLPEIRLYPNLERIGLRTGSMEPIQYDVMKKVLHVVPSFNSVDDLLANSSAWKAIIVNHLTWVTDENHWPGIVAAVQSCVSDSLGNTYAEEKRTALRMLDRNMFSSRGGKIAAGASFRWTRAYALARHRNNFSSNFPLNNELKKYFKTSDINPSLTTSKVADPESPPAPRALTKAHLAGMTFAHQGYRIHNGYGGEKIKPALDSLAVLNVNALAIVPYTYMRDPNKPTELPIPTDAGSENDWATICSLREADKRGWFTLLKPQIWIGGGLWPGDVDFLTEEDWDTFFSNYEFWIMHYALLAERENVDALCLGTELVKTTRKHPDRWRAIIRNVRAVYGGQLTYAANWGEEFDNFTFWDDLDAVGLNSYYPLSEKDSPTDEELLAGARRWFEMAAKVSQASDRPLWLTEVGYRAVGEAWKNPHAEANGRVSDPAAQARCYRAMLTAAAETPELTGMFLWKWPSYLGVKNRRNPGTEFCVGGKPAATIFKEYNAGIIKR